MRELRLGVPNSRLIDSTTPPRIAARGRWALRLLFGLLLAAIAFGAWTGFPVYDDAYMVLFLREAGVAALEAQHPHRPLFGLLLRWAAEAFGTRPGPYVAMAAGFWAVLVWQTARLCRRIAPSAGAVVPVAGLLTLAPILVSTQYTTATTVLPANLPVSLGLAALLLVLGTDEGTSRAKLLAVALLLAASVLLSEYGIAVGAASVALLLVAGRYRPAAAFSVGIGVGYAAFRATADLSVRVKQSPAAQLGILARHPHAAALRFLEGLWTSLVGAWGAGAGAIRLSAADRGTWLAACVGLGAAVLIGRRARRSDSEAAEPFRNGGLMGLVAAVGAGILPVVLANRSLAGGDPYETRYLLPVLPFAAVAVALGLVRVASPRYRPLILAAVAFVAADRIVAGAFETRRQQRRMEEIGSLLHPLVAGSAGITIAVVPDEWRLDGSDMTPKVAWRWSDADARRVWVMPASRAAVEFGARDRCRGTERAALAAELMSVPRVGELSHLVWLPWSGRSPEDLEPYCVGPVR